MRRRSLVFLLLLAVAAPVALAQAKVPPRPTATTITRLLRTQYTQESKQYPSVRERYTIKSLKRGTPRIGKYLSDGTPPHTRTYVFPIKATGIHFRCYSDGSVKRGVIRGDYVFFKNEFHEWTFRIRSEEQTPAGQDHYAGRCPF